MSAVDAVEDADRDDASAPAGRNLLELPARIAQHEIDHLDGVLIIDRMSLAEKTLAEPKLRDLIRARDEHAQDRAK